MLVPSGVAVVTTVPYDVVAPVGRSISTAAVSCMEEKPEVETRDEVEKLDATSSSFEPNCDGPDMTSWRYRRLQLLLLNFCFLFAPYYPSTGARKHLTHSLHIVTYNNYYYVKEGNIIIYWLPVLVVWGSDQCVMIADSLLHVYIILGERVAPIYNIIMCMLVVNTIKLCTARSIM